MSSGEVQLPCLSYDLFQQVAVLRGNIPRLYTLIDLSRDKTSGPSSTLLNLLTCVDCAETMTLTHITPGEVGFQRLNFRCDECHRTETVIVKAAHKD